MPPHLTHDPPVIHGPALSRRTGQTSRSGAPLTQGGRARLWRADCTTNRMGQPGGSSHRTSSHTRSHKADGATPTDSMREEVDDQELAQGVRDDLAAAAVLSTSNGRGDQQPGHTQQSLYFGPLPNTPSRVPALLRLTWALCPFAPPRLSAPLRLTTMGSPMLIKPEYL